MLRRCLLVICVLFTAAEAHAATIQITSGGISNVNNFGFPPDTYFSLQGPFFVASGINFASGSVLPGFTGFSIYFGAEGGIDGFFPAQVTLEGFAPCIAELFFTTCGGLQLTFAPITPNGNPTPFTATGQAFFGNGNCATPIGQPLPPNCLSFDLVGQGLATLRTDTAVPPDLFATFTFSAPTPEPSTLVLLSMGILALLLGLRFIKSAGQAHH
jgi:hypothetical protein